MCQRDKIKSEVHNEHAYGQPRPFPQAAHGGAEIRGEKIGREVAR